MYTKFWSGNLKGKDNSENLDPDGRIILHRVDLKRNGVESCGLDSCDSGYGQVAFCCEHGNEPLFSIKGRKFLG
jgi:hypothetical protein